MRRNQMVLALGTSTILIVAVTNVHAAQIRPEIAGVPNAPERQLVYEENLGQFPPDVHYLARGDGFNFALSKSPTIELYRATTGARQPSRADIAQPSKPAPKSMAWRSSNLTRLRIKFLGSNEEAVPVGVQSAQGRVNYLVGPSQKHWKTDARRYHRIRYTDVYPGIHVEYYTKAGLPEYDFRIAPGADPSRIAIKFDGADKIAVDATGELRINAAGQGFVQQAPVSWQVIDGERRPVQTSYIVRGGIVRLELGSYDPHHELIIDPVLDFSTYFGGPGREAVYGVDIDSDGYIYLVGTSTSVGLATPGAFQEYNYQARVEVAHHGYCPSCPDAGPLGDVTRYEIHRNRTSVFVTKLTPDGRTHIWTTYVGPADPRAPNSFHVGTNSIGVSGAGEVAFATEGNQPGLPLLNQTQSFDDTTASNDSHYVAKLNQSGTGLVFGTYLRVGRSFTSTQRGLDIAEDGSVAVVGAVGSDNDLPEINSIDGQDCSRNSDSTDSDGYIVLFDPGGKAVFSSCIGGTESESASLEWLRAVRIGSGGLLHLAGHSSTTDYPLVNPLQSTPGYAGSRAAIVTSLDPGVTPVSLVFSTYFGPSEEGAAPVSGTQSQRYYPYDLAVDSQGNLILSGVTNELHFPVINGYQGELNTPKSSYAIEADPRAVFDLFVTKINPNTPLAVFSTYLGGSGAEYGFQPIVVDGDDNIYVTTITTSSDYPVAGGIVESLSGDTDLAITKMTPAGRVSWSTYLGGTTDAMERQPGGIAVDTSTGRVIVAGTTFANDFPIESPVQAENIGMSDATLTIFSEAADDDADGDGVIDASDQFPDDSDEWRDIDSDGVGDNADDDDDGDGVDDENDAFPQEPLWVSDADGDGFGDASDLFGSDPTVVYDFDGDGIGDAVDSDADGDGCGNNDRFPEDPARCGDIDNDGIANLDDVDNDNDGLDDVVDPSHLNADYPVITFNMLDPAGDDIVTGLPSQFSTPNGSRSWTADYGDVFSGDISLGTRLLSHAEAAVVETTREMPEGQLEFMYKVSSEAEADVFSFLIDGDVVLEASGEVGWTKFASTVEPGSHTLQWRYDKNPTITAGDDAAWIDDVNVNAGISNDLAISVENERTAVMIGEVANYYVAVRNYGLLQTHDDVLVEVSTPPELGNVTWTCDVIGPDAECPATEGVGAFTDLVDLDGRSGILIVISGQVLSAAEGEFTVEATVSPPESYPDAIASNNVDRDIDYLGIFGTGFEELSID